MISVIISRLRRLAKLLHGRAGSGRANLEEKLHPLQTILTRTTTSGSSEHDDVRNVLMGFMHGNVPGGSKTLRGDMALELFDRRDIEDLNSRPNVYDLDVQFSPNGRYLARIR